MKHQTDTDTTVSPMSKTPWVLFLVITTVFFITGHDLLRNQNALFRSTEEFNPTEEEAIQILAQYESGQMYKAVTYLAFGAFAVLSLLAFQRFNPVTMRGVYSRFAVAFLVWCVLSLAWTFDRSITFNKLAILVLLSIAAVAAAQRFRMEDVAWLVVFSGTVYLLAGIGSELYLGTFRPWVSGYRFSGTIHPNGQGMNCALLLLAALFLFFREQQWRKTLLAIAIFGGVFLLMTKSRTPIGAIGASLLIFGLLRLPLSLKVATAAAVGLVLAAIPIFRRLLDSVLETLYLMGRTDVVGSEAKNLSGRADLWDQCWHFIKQQPFIGYGYNSFWTVDNTRDIAEKIDWYSGSAHSVYIDIVLGLGFVGLALYLILLFAGIARFLWAYQASGDNSYAFAAVLLLFSLVHGIMESAFLYPAIYMFLVTMLFARAAFVREPFEQEASETAPESGRQLAVSH